MESKQIKWGQRKKIDMQIFREEGKFWMRKFDLGEKDEKLFLIVQDAQPVFHSVLSSKVPTPPAGWGRN